MVLKSVWVYWFSQIVLDVDRLVTEIDVNSGDNIPRSAYPVLSGPG